MAKKKTYRCNNITKSGTYCITVGDTGTIIGKIITDIFGVKEDYIDRHEIKVTGIKNERGDYIKGQVELYIVTNIKGPT
jgi:hypothetical protein